ncbi:TonB-dependent receptor [Lysobacter sp. CFH 32150]|uniref:TonB-dependent receptor plug domain-containing protein n=1 Tax=Lysobacter sp. CFH 32150 TaxID=2927128 RepID=UPI001FA7E339|nr:TonB-dependent receptor [Lysobacter sp. CFH 32150]MCI4569104.1 TonB-dependent receptor [Lysobacter sp. CFH 32150]
MTNSQFHRNALASALALVLFAPIAAQAQAQTTPANQSEEQRLDELTPDEQAAKDNTAKKPTNTLDTVVVTGSRIKRAEIEGPAPVTVITGEQMKKEGFATVYDALQTLTEAIGNVQNDYDWGQTSVNAYPLNLRNLGPGRSLLLINGHRVADYPMPYQGKSNFANYNNIPTGIVDRIEVLSGSASAIYGSDAMAGVVNVVLKEHAEGQTVRVKYGEATRGGRENLDLVFSGGVSGEKWNLVYNLQHFDRGVLLAKERPFMDGEEDKHFDTWNPGERALGVAPLRPYPGNYVRDQDNGGRRMTPPAGACDQYGDLMYLAERWAYDRNTGVATSTGQYCAQRVFQNWALRTGSEDNSGYLYGTYNFTDDLQGWASLGVWKSTGDFNTFLDGFASGTFFDPTVNNGAGGNRFILKHITPQEWGGEDKLLTKSRELAVDFSTGLRGTMIDDRFDWEAMVGRAEYEVKESFPTYNQGDMFDFFMGPDLGGGTYAPDYNKVWNPLSPDDVARFTDRGHKKARSWLTQASFTVNGDLFEGWAGPIGFAGVLEASKQGYRLTPDPKILNQDEDGWYTPFGNIEQGGGERKHYAAGVEFRVPLLKKLTMSAATRYDKYDAVRDGAKNTYQLGLEWRPADSLLVRGSYGTAFRAPDMHYTYALPSSGISDFTDYLACAQGGWPNQQCPRDTFKIEDATVNRGGTPDLKYEEGESYTVGFVWDAFTNFSVSADYWDVSIENLIDDISEEQLLRDEAYCQANGFSPDGSVRAVPPTAEWCAEVARRIQRTPGVPGSVAGSVSIGINPINRAETQVSGVDVTARYRLPATQLGDWSFGLNYTNMLTYKSRGFPTEELKNTRKEKNPRTKITASVNWIKDDWNATLMMYQKSGGRDNRWGGCEPLSDGFSDHTRINDTTCQDTDPNSPTFGETSARHYERRAPRRYFNGSVGYQFNEAWRFNLYVSNIFDKIYGDKWCGDFAYCVDDPVGREISAEIVYKFD